MTTSKTTGRGMVRLIAAGSFLAVAALALANGGRTETSATPPAATATDERQGTATPIIAASQGFFAAPPFMVAEEVYGKIVKGGDPSFFLVSLQSRAGFAGGHLPGAVNLPFEELADPASLALLPRDKTIVLTCDDGHRSAAAALFLSQLGYRTAMMAMGLSHWNPKAAGIASPYQGSAGYPVSSEETVATASYPLPHPAAVPGATSIAERTAELLRSGRSLFIDRREVYEQAVKKGDPNSFLVSLQRPEDYVKGHVPGAVNIPYDRLTQPQELAKLPADKKIILICYIGHYAGAGALFLNQLGYEAYDMRFGTLGWNDTSDGLGPAEKKGFLASLGKSLDLPVSRK